MLAHTETSILSDKEDLVPETKWIMGKGPFLANWVLRGAFLFFVLALLYALFLSNQEELRWKILYSGFIKASLSIISRIPR